MKIINIVKNLPWKRSNGKMNKSSIDTLVVHHDGIEFDPKCGYNTMNRILSEAKYHVSKPDTFGGHIAYHFIIDNIGDIYQCLPEDEIGYHAGNIDANRRSIAVCLHGNFERQAPTKAQIKALTEFCRYMFTKRPDLPVLVKRSLKGHREVRLSPTACPGRNLFPLVQKLRK
jgi:hypothetical protein